MVTAGASLASGLADQSWTTRAPAVQRYSRPPGQAGPLEPDPSSVTRAPWQTLWSLPAVLPDFPAVAQLSSGFYDLTSGAWFIQNLYAGKESQYAPVERYKASEFSPAAMAGRGVR